MGMAVFVRKRAGKSGFLVPEAQANLMDEMTVDDVLNTLGVLSFVETKVIDRAVLDRFDLRRINIERRLARFLMKNGKKAFLDAKIPDYDERRFLLALLDELVRFLRVKTATGGTPQIRANNLGLSFHLYKEYSVWTDKVAFVKLYDRLFTCLNLLKWSRYKGVSQMLLGLW
jgi:hypothetical protein